MASIAVDHTISALEFFSYSVSIIRPTVVGFTDKFLKNKALRWLENASFKFASTNAAFYDRDILLIFEAEFTGSVL